MNNNWFAVFVKTGEEDNVKERLQYRLKDSLKIFVPKRKLRERKNGIWKENVRTLFPGYVLVNGEMNIERYCKFKEVPGLVKVICSENEPIKIARNEIDILGKLICNGEIIGFSKVFIENNKVIILDGPLKLVEGRIVSVDKRKGRAKIKLYFLGEDRTIDLGVSILKLVEYN